MNNRGLAWTSTDGRNWTLHDGIATFAHGSLLGLVTDGTRLVAFGAYTAPSSGEYFEPVGATWVSEDGVTWTRSTGTAPWVAAVDGHRFVGATSIVRNSESIIRPETSKVSFVTSTDGLHWTRTSPTFDAYLGYQTLGASAFEQPVLAVTQSGTAMAIGQTPVPNPTDGVTWRTSDGLTWSTAQRLASGFRPQSIAVSDESFLVAGWSSPPDANEGHGEVWRLSSGVESVPVLSATANSAIDHVFAVGDTVVAVGWDDVGNVAWVSTDGGRSFTRIGGKTPFTVAWVAGILGTPDGLLAFGGRGVGESGTQIPAVWLGQ